jgi:hypothetical protein
MTTALISRLCAAVLLNFPAAWLYTSETNRRAAWWAAELAAGRSPAAPMHGFGYHFYGLLILSVTYVVLVEAIAFVFRGDWRRGKVSASSVGGTV